MQAVLAIEKKIYVFFVLVFPFFLCVCPIKVIYVDNRQKKSFCHVLLLLLCSWKHFSLPFSCFTHSLFHTHTHINVRCGALHVVPAFAEVVSELTQRTDAQFLLEFRMLFLFGRQNLPECINLLFQLDTHKKTKSCFTCPFTGSVLATLFALSSKWAYIHVWTYFNQFLLNLLSLLLCHNVVV